MKKPESSKDNGSKKTMEIREYDVLRTKVFDSGNVVADIMLNGVSIYGVRVVEGKNGDFLSFPQRKGSDGKYYSIVYAPLSQDDQIMLLNAIERKLNE